MSFKLGFSFIETLWIIQKFAKILRPLIKLNWIKIVNKWQTFAILWHLISNKSETLRINLSAVIDFNICQYIITFHLSSNSTRQLAEHIILCAVHWTVLSKYGLLDGFYEIDHIFFAIYDKTGIILFNVDCIPLKSFRLFPVFSSSLLLLFHFVSLFFGYLDEWKFP